MPGFGGAGGAWAAYVGRHPNGHVAPVCIHRMVGVAPNERVEERIVWVDGLTGGTRLARRREVKLTRVGRPAGLTQVYAITQGDAAVAIVPTRGKVWGHATPPEQDPVAAVNCSVMQFEFRPKLGAPWSAPSIMAGPVSTVDEAWTGPQVWIEVRGLRDGADIRVRADSHPWQGPRTEG